jgi:hypothetical protein
MTEKHISRAQSQGEPYHLSEAEQRVLKRALRASVKVVCSCLHCTHCRGAGCVMCDGSGVLDWCPNCREEQRRNA